MKNIIGITVLFLAFSCSNENAKTTVEQAPIDVESVEKEAIIEPVEDLETLPNNIRLFLIENITGIEGTMYESGGSFSLPDANSAKNFVNFIKNEAPKNTTKQQVGHLLLLDKDGNQLSLVMVFRDNDMVYTKYTDSETGKFYYNVLTGQASDLFLNVQIQKVAE